MYVAGVWAKTAKGYFKNVKKQVNATSEKGLEQFIVFLKLKSTF